MSNRGNPDYYKIKGTRTEEPDIARPAHQKLAQQQAEERHRRRKPHGPEATPLFLHHKPQFKSPEQAEAEARAREVLPSSEAHAGPGWTPPSVAEAAKMAVTGMLRLATWAAGATLRFGARIIRRRVGGLLDYVRQS